MFIKTILIQFDEVSSSLIKLEFYIEYRFIYVQCASYPIRFEKALIRTWKERPIWIFSHSIVVVYKSTSSYKYTP